MTPQQENLRQLLLDLEKGRDVLNHSHEKCRNISLDRELSYGELESFEALTSRFARLSDIVIQKALRLLDILDLEEVGTVRDRINRAEKKGVIRSADSFIDIRVLRNEIAHEYKTDTIYAIFARTLELAPNLMDGVVTIAEYAKKYETPGK